MKVILILAAICAGVTAYQRPRVAAAIVGGEPALIEDFPSSASLRKNGQHTCGCVLLSESQVLTAGSCVDGQPMIEFDVYYGSADRVTGGSIAPALRYSLHPSYDPFADGDPNDIATVDATMVFDGVTSAAAVMTSGNSDFHDESCTITGWGSTTSSGGLSQILNMATVTVLTNFDCNQRYSNNNLVAISEGHLCVSDETAQTVTGCTGDEGSPIYCSEAGVQVAAGLLSFSGVTFGQCTGIYPSVYTRFSSYFDWIPGY